MLNEIFIEVNPEFDGNRWKELTFKVNETLFEKRLLEYSLLFL